MKLEIVTRHTLDKFMKRFDSGRQALAVCIIAIVAALLLAGTGSPVRAQHCPRGQITCAEWCERQPVCLQIRGDA
jgi:hypothetical protein